MARPDITVEVALKDTGLKEGFKAIAKVVDKFTKNANTLIKTQKKLEAQQKKLKTTQRNLAKQQKQNNVELKKQTVAIKNQLKQQKKQEIQEKKLETSSLKQAKAVDKIIAKIKEHAGVTKFDNDIMKQLSLSHKTLARAYKGDEMALETLRKAESRYKAEMMARRTETNKAIVAAKKKEKQDKKLAVIAEKQRIAEKNLVQVRVLARAQLKQMANAAKEAGVTFKQLGISLRTVKQALGGSTVAIGQMNKSLKLANITIKKTHSGLFNITNGGRLLSNGFATMRSKLLLASFAMTLVSSAILRQVKLFGEQEESVLKMARVFGTDSAIALGKYSSALQQVTMFGDETINSVIATMGAFGANEEQAKGLTEATLDLAAGLGIDLNTAGQLIAKTFGSSTNALSRYGVELESGLSQQERFIAITDGVKQKFGELSKLMAKTTKGQLAQTSNAFGDMQERLGEALVPMVLAFAKALKGISEALPLSVLRGLIGALASLTAAFVAGKTATFAYTSGLAILKAGKIGLMLVTGKATVVQRAFNMAVKSNPYVAAASAIAFLVTGVASYLSSTDELSEDQKKLNERINEVAKEMGLLRNATDKLDETQTDYIKSVLESEAAIQKQIDTIQAEIELKGVALEIKKKEIELGRDLEKGEAQLVKTLEHKKSVQQNLRDAEKDIISLKEYLIDLRKDDVDTQIEEAEVMLNKALLMNMMGQLTAAEAEGIDTLRQNIDDLKNSRTEDGESVKTQKDIYDILIDAYNKTKEAQLELIEAQILEARVLAEKGLLNNEEMKGLFSLIQSYNQLKAVKKESNKDDEKDAKIKEALLKKEIALNKQILTASIQIGKSHSNAGNAAAAAAKQVIIAKLQEAVTTYMAGAMAKIPFPLNIGVPALGAAMFGALSSVLSGSSSSGASGSSGGGSSPVGQYAEGGYVGGNRHSQGGTIIEAERGEFVMSRNAVQSIGLETLNQMNQSGGGGNINVSVTGNVLTQDFVEGELAESIKEAVRRGSDFGIG